MRSSAFVWAAVCVTAMHALVIPAAPAPRPTPARIAGFIEALGHDDFERREVASAALLEIGLPALPALRKASACPDAEVRWRVRRLLRAIPERLLVRRFEGDENGVI